MTRLQVICVRTYLGLTIPYHMPTRCSFGLHGGIGIVAKNIVQSGLETVED